jgi:hypothetical protein
MTDESAWCYVLVVTRQWKVSKQEPIVCGEQEAVKNSLGAKTSGGIVPLRADPSSHLRPFCSKRTLSSISGNEHDA